MQELLVAADQYNVIGIVAECCEFLEANLEPANCIGVKNVSFINFHVFPARPWSPTDPKLQGKLH